MGPLAAADMKKNGILASLTIAQAILESDTGKCSFPLRCAAGTAFPLVDDSPPYIAPSLIITLLPVLISFTSKDLKGDGKTTGAEIFVTIAEKTIGVEKKILQALAAFKLKNRGVRRKNYTVIARCLRFFLFPQPYKQLHLLLFQTLSQPPDRLHRDR